MLTHLSTDFGAPVATLTMDAFSDRVLPCRENMLYVPSYPHEYMAWGFLDQSLRLYSDRKVSSSFLSSLKKYTNVCLVDSML
jgi:hypothetical protein